MSWQSPSRSTRRPPASSFSLDMEPTKDAAPYGYFGLSAATDDVSCAWRQAVPKASSSNSRAMGSSAAIKAEDGDSSTESLNESEDHEDSFDTSSPDTSGNDSDGSFSDQSMSIRTGGGIYVWFPGLYEWIHARTTTTMRLLVMFAFVAADAARFLQLEYAVKPHINMQSVFFLASALSFSLALAVSAIIDGLWAFRVIFSRHTMARMLVVALMFMCSTLLTALAYKTGMSPVYVIMLSKLYLPIAALASVIAFERRYSTLEWLSMGMLMLGIAAFVLLRYQCHYSYCHAVDHAIFSLQGMFLLLVSLGLGAPASIIAEGILQHKQTAHSSRRNRKRPNNKYTIVRAQMDMWMTLLWGVVWFFSISHDVNGVVETAEEGLGDKGLDADDMNVVAFGHWTKRQYFLVLILIAQSWLAGLAVQQYSTVSKGVAESISTVFAVLMVDPWMDKYGFSTRAIPSLLITLIVILSALIFQTGRINVKAMKKLLVQSRTTTDSPFSMRRATNCLVDGRAWTYISTYSVIIFYILADSFRSTIMYVVQANRFFVPQTMAIMSAFCGVGFASVMTARQHGISGLRRAWQPWKLYRFLLCGFLQAVTTSLSSMAYALGTSPALVVALGKVYTPLVAVFSRCILGRSFMWLEWFALVILTAASFAFGFMEDLGKNASSSSTPIEGMLCVIGSAAASCLMSLVMERLMRSENDPFIMHKVRLDFGSAIFSIAFLPILGWLGTLPGNRRTDVAYWTWRSGPDYWACQDVAMRTSRTAANGCDQATGEFLVNWTKVGDSSDLKAEAARCICGMGVTLGWGENYMIYVGLAAVVFHSWITGVLVSQFSSIYRAVADGVPVLLIYFLLDPLFSRVPLPPFQSAYPVALPVPPLDWARDCLCLILPLSGTTFSVASAQMERVHRPGKPSGLEEPNDYDDGGEEDKNLALITSDLDVELSPAASKRASLD